ncbi:MAG: 1-acyl-sn-glycerol-3-phosphate acyltransferase [Bacteroidales bacterium]|jgi:1-acyl-sn-glycerol-3-phosphate acyltransferase|nr:1-acyl-sn-glycerol-3-phosphate acyltransferase [Bacteroidales bacterium]
MIIKARHHPVVDPFFTWYVERTVKRHFHEIRFINRFEDRGWPVLLIANHMSWWDGMWLRVFNQRYLGRKFNFMILEEQLRKHWYFQYIGGFSVQKGSRSVLESLGHAAELLGNNENLVLMFPQGEIQSMHTGTFVFDKGIEAILKRTVKKVQVLMTVNLVEYYSQKKPSLFSYTRELDETVINHEHIERAYNEFYRQCISAQLKIKDI